MITPQSRSDNNEQPWERLAGESPQAHEDFQEFLKQGPRRTYLATARARRRAYSLIRRHAKQFNWRERARAFDNFQDRDLDAERRSARREFAQRQEEEAWQLWRLGLALVYRFVQRDPDTGEWRIDEKLAPKDALALLRFVSDLLAQIRLQPNDAGENDTQVELSWAASGAGAEGKNGTPQDELGITHPGLRRLLGLVSPDSNSNVRLSQPKGGAK